MLRFIIATLIAALSLPVAFAQEPDRIPWARDFREAAEVAAREKKLILLHFYADDCPPCRRLEANVFPQAEVAAAVTQAYIPVKVHVDRAPELARRYQITRWPTDVIVTPVGLEVYRTVSPQDAKNYTAMLTDVAQRSGTRIASNTQPPPVDQVRQQIEAAAQPVVQNQTPTYNPTAVPQNATVQNGPYQPLPTNTGAQPQPNMPANNSDFQAGNTTPPPSDPYANPYVPNNNTNNSSSYNSDYAGDFNPAGQPQGDSSYVANTPPTQNVPSQNSLPPAPDFSQPSVQPEVKQPANPVAETQPAKPALPPLGLDGYCVVTLAEAVAWKKGDKRFGAIHRGRLYLFASDIEQKKFLAEPDRYSPALSGYDPVQYAESGKLVDGKRAHGLSFNNQMYLFETEAALQTFQAEPRKYLEAVHQAMLRADSATKFR